MTSTAKRRRTALVRTAAALGLAATGALAVELPVPAPAHGPVQAHPVERTEPATAYDPALRPSATSRSGVRAALPLPGTDEAADAALLTDGQGPR